MKKTLVFVLLLGFLGAAAFAADMAKPALAFNGYLDIGALMSSSGSTTSLYAVGQDSWDNGGRFQLEGKYAADTWGIAFRLRWDDLTGVATGTATLKLKRAWAWANILNGMVNFNVGRLASYDWATGVWESFGNQDGAVGIQAEVLPIKGLNAGVFLPLLSSATDISTTLQKVVVGLKYSMDAFNAQVGYDLGGKYLWVGGAFTGMSALTAAVEAKLLMTDTSTANYTYLGEHFAYAIGSITPYLWAQEQFNTSSTVSMWMAFAPGVDFTVNKTWKVGAFGRFALSGSDSGYGAGAYAKAALAGGYVALGLQYDGGTVGVNYATELSNGDPVYDPQLALPAMTDSVIRAYLTYKFGF